MTEPSPSGWRHSVLFVGGRSCVPDEQVMRAGWACTNTTKYTRLCVLVFADQVDLPHSGVPLVGADMVNKKIKNTERS